MNNCVRCKHICQAGELHIFHGGENHRKLTELLTGRKTSLCKVLVRDEEMDAATFEDGVYKEKRIAKTNAEFEADAIKFLAAFEKASNKNLNSDKKQ